MPRKLGFIIVTNLKFKTKNIFVFCLFPLILTYIYSVTYLPENNLLLLTNLLVLFLSFIGMVLEPDKKYTLSKLVFVFIFFFFGVVPLNDELNNNLYWSGKQFDILFKIVSNVLIIIGLLAFSIGTKIRLNIASQLVSALPEIKKINIFFVTLVFGAVAFLILYVNSFDLPRLLFRGLAIDLASEAFVELGQMETLLFNNFIRSMPILLLVIFFYLYQKNKQSFSNIDRLKFRVVGFLFFVLAIILVAPTSVPRFQAAALYIPLIIVFTKIWERPYWMQVTILGALLVVLPFLDKFRHFNPETFSWSLDLGFLNHGHFDAYQNFVRVIEVDFFSSGQQLLGALLFFVPRSFWESKPVGSGAALAELAGYDFSNISMPFIAEGFINFGVIGVAIFMFLLGLILGNLDRIAWTMKRKGIDGLFLYYYYFLFGMVFFIMRGDLMSSFAYTVGLTVAFWFLVVLLKISGMRYKF